MFPSTQVDGDWQSFADGRSVNPAAPMETTFLHRLDEQFRSMPLETWRDFTRGIPAEALIRDSRGKVHTFRQQFLFPVVEDWLGRLAKSMVVCYTPRLPGLATCADG